MRRTATYADGWLPYMYTPEQLYDSIEKIKAYRQEAGRDVESFIPGVFIFTATHADGDTGREMAANRLGRQYAQDFSKLVGKYALSGTPDECRKRLQEYIDAGAKMVMLPSACPADYIEENTRLIAQEIIPAFR
jgi:alkanesulfonate monooxygenase SsuD/methylene tetrahydromethanopterin reductase-like flavin-dependent oxidoreductase (luciferase family)